MERLVGSPDGSVPVAATLLPDLRRGVALPPEIAASGALDAVPPAAGEDEFPAPMPGDACAEKLVARAQVFPEPDGREFPILEPAPCTLGAVQFAA
jgi:hypothetical protein